MIRNIWELSAALECETLHDIAVHIREYCECDITTTFAATSITFTGNIEWHPWHDCHGERSYSKTLQYPFDREKLIVTLRDVIDGIGLAWSYANNFAANTADIEYYLNLIQHRYFE